MPQFYYKAKKDNADTVFGQIFAEHREEVVEKLNQQGLLPINVEEIGISSAPQGRAREVKVRTKDIYRFTRQLLNLMRAGIPILRALEILTSQLHNPYFQRVTDEIRTFVQSGKSFSDSLAQFPKIFSRVYIAMVKVGEESGNLIDALNEISLYERQIDETRKRVINALTYPLFVFGFGILTMCFILMFVMPKITLLFDSYDQSLPGITVFVMILSRLATDWRVLLGCGIICAGLIAWFRVFARTLNGRYWMSKVVLRIPFLGEFLLKIELARFCKTLELLMSGGVPIVRALKLSIPIIRNVLVKEQLEECHEALLAGRSFGASLKRSSLIPPIMGHLVVVGEVSGSLNETVRDLGEEYNRETGEMIEVLSKLLEPILIIVVGSMIGFLIMAMLMPIFQMDIFSG